MEIFMTHISFSATISGITNRISKIVHAGGTTYDRFNKDRPMNFTVILHRIKQSRGYAGSFRTGCITFPWEEVGNIFLEDCRFGRVNSSEGGLQKTRFRLSNKPPQAQVVEMLLQTPFIDPAVQAERESMLNELKTNIQLSAVQFGWECRDEVFSIEWERGTSFSSQSLQFDAERKEILTEIKSSHTGQERIVIPFSQILRTCATSASGTAAVVFFLRSPPIFEAEQLVPEPDHNDPSLLQFQAMYGGLSKEKRQRRSSLFGSSHARAAQFTSFAMRIVLKDFQHLAAFRRCWRVSKVKARLENVDYPVERRQLFSESMLSAVTEWVIGLGWPLAFQVHALLLNGSLDPKELLSVREDIQHMVSSHGVEFAIEVIQKFHAELLNMWYSDDAQAFESVTDCFKHVLDEFKTQRRTPTSRLLSSNANDLFSCHHVMVTPTRISLHGPHPERSNRVTRQYANHNGNFLRVSFVDETNLNLRFDRDVDGVSFVKARVGHMLHNGLNVAGRNFHFLGYSQSALKDHTVWFVHPFWDEESRCMVDVDKIIKSIGEFDSTTRDPMAELIRCPARYAARISQAFTATDMSVTIRAGEVREDDDIKTTSGLYCFTDGVGTMSRALADEIWETLLMRRRRGITVGRTRSAALQIRFQGSKGMVSVDHRLEDRVLVLRPSMIKFDAFNTHDIGVAAYFTKPGKFYLNRPLITLLEGLGVSADVFLDLQRTAVEEIKKSTGSLEASAKLLESYGLGSSFRLSSTMLNLSKFNCDLSANQHDRMMKMAVFHILRELKQRARIPAPGYTLVGVADVHQYLEEGEVYICIEESGEERKYLQGPVLVTRSPVIHPGDAQIAYAIGPPPPNSPFAIEPLQNTVVFATQGSRPLPSLLGGGDLDGDPYNVTDYVPLHPDQTEEPADYHVGQRNMLDHPSTIHDIADFVVEYINSDNLGIIAKNWLITADQSGKGIYDKDCLTLAKLHSDAVDYPKTGVPVPMMNIPRLKHSAKPDWDKGEIAQPETVFYPSNKALGLLYRDIELSHSSFLDVRKRNARPHYRAPDADSEDEDVHINHELKQMLLNWDTPSRELEDSVYCAVRLKADQYLHVEGADFIKDSSIVKDLFENYASELERICASHTLSYRQERLLELEALLGVITMRTPQPRRRRQLMSRLREQTTQLVVDIRCALEGEECNSHEKLAQAVEAWEYSWDMLDRDVFGARSFWWICLGAIFEAIRLIEEDQKAEDEDGD